MRNGNKNEKDVEDWNAGSSYPTYEEWKLLVSCIDANLIETFLSYL